jgi:hypothetical protein
MCIVILCALFVVDASAQQQGIPPTALSREA